MGAKSESKLCETEKHIDTLLARITNEYKERDLSDMWQCARLEDDKVGMGHSTFHSVLQSIVADMPDGVVPILDFCTASARTSSSTPESRNTRTNFVSRASSNSYGSSATGCSSRRT